jgi:hypothetical protein
MSLRDYVIPTRTIPLGGENKFTVRALGFDDIQRLLIERTGLVETALSMFGDGGFDPNGSDDAEVRSFALRLIATLPDLVAELIATAADEADLAPTVRRLPAPVQLEAFMAAYELTFAEPGSVGKFFGRLTDLVASIPKPNRAMTAADIHKELTGGPILSGSNASGAM